MPEENVFMLSNGCVFELDKDQGKIVSKIPSGNILVDGLGVGDVGNIVLRDRKHLSEDGLMVVVVSMSKDTGRVVSGPDIISRGFVYVRESERLLEEVKQTALAILEDCAENNVHEWGIIKNRIKDDVSKLIGQRTRRAPMILPILQEV